MIILGAGLAGLSAAYHLEGSVVYEQASQVGGRAKSIQKYGFTFDQGIHVLHTKNGYILELLNGPAYSMLTEHERKAWIYHYDVLTRYPFQANLYGLPVEVVKDCLLGFIENPFSIEQVETYKDWVCYQFGRGIAERFMLPYSMKFWGVPSQELTTDWVGVRHPRPSLEEVITGAIGEQEKGFGVNATFRYPKQGGFGTIAASLAEAIGKDRIRLGMRVSHLDVERCEIEFNGGEFLVPYQYLISTIPLPDLFTLIPNVPKSVREAVRRLRANSILVVNLGIDRPNLSEKHWIYYPEKEYSFFRISFPMNKAPEMVPSGKSSVSVEIAYGNGTEVDRRTIVAQVVDDLRRSRILKPEDHVIFSELIDIPYAYVIYDKNREPALKKIHNFLNQHQVYPCGRYGEWGYLWSDEAILSGQRAAQIVQMKINANGQHGLNVSTHPE